MRASSLSVSRTTCGSLLQELQKIWDETGESDTERDKMLLELEQECLDIYRRKVENSRKYKADLKQALCEAEVEITSLISALGEQMSFTQVKGTLKQQLAALNPTLEDLRLKKQHRVKEFLEVQGQIISICAEIAGNDDIMSKVEPQVDKHDLTFKRLAELKSHLEELRKEKVLRLQKVNEHISAIHEFSVVMSTDFKAAVNEAHPSLVDHEVGKSKSISNETIAKLTAVVDSLRQEKQKRLQKIQDLGSALVELWNLLDTSTVEQKRFDDVVSLISSTLDGASKQGCLSLEFIERTEIEVDRLNALKVKKMKELILKRRHDLEEIYNEVHMEIDNDDARQRLISLTESGNVDLSDLLLCMDHQIRNAKDEAQSRKDILDKVDKWSQACAEEIWLDEYEKDDNRYSAGRGAHKNLKRAEKARILVGKIPSIVENLITKVKAWEAEKGMTFLYDKAPLLNKLEKYILVRQQREEEKRRSREQRRLHEQLASDKEALFGSRTSNKKPLALNNSSNNTIVGTPIGRRVGTPYPSSRHHGLYSSKDRRESGRAIPVNCVALVKEDLDSHGK